MDALLIPSDSDDSGSFLPPVGGWVGGSALLPLMPYLYVTAPYLSLSETLSIL